MICRKFESFSFFFLEVPILTEPLCREIETLFFTHRNRSLCFRLNPFYQSLHGIKRAIEWCWFEFLFTCETNTKSTKVKNAVFAHVIYILQSKCTQKLYHSKELQNLYQMSFVSRVSKRCYRVVFVALKHFCKKIDQKPNRQKGRNLKKIHAIVGVKSLALLRPIRMCMLNSTPLLNALSSVGSFSKYITACQFVKPSCIFKMVFFCYVYPCKQKFIFFKNQMQLFSINDCEYFEQRNSE